MIPRHSKAYVFAASSLFEGLQSFPELEQRIQGLKTPELRGWAFEVFVEAYLAIVRRADFTEVYPQDTAPSGVLASIGLTVRDLGADGVALSLAPLEGWSSYQAKFRSTRASLSWQELSTFIGQSDSARILQRVLVTNSDSLPTEALALRERFIGICGSDLDALTAHELAGIAAYVGRRPSTMPGVSPRPHQKDGLHALALELECAQRATGVMACGSGKTLIGLWLAERRKARRVLVLVPSLALMKQVMGEWMRHNRWDSLAYLAVCSDPTVEPGGDEIQMKPSELGFEVKTDPVQVRAFLSAPFSGVKLVFSTYQSAPVVGAAMTSEDHFDLVVFDEAHKTAGPEGRKFAFALFDGNIRADKRLFLTATPRHCALRSRSETAPCSPVQMFSMDDPAVYGRQAYKLSIREAVARNIIVPYKVIISIITSQQVTEEMLRSDCVVFGDREVRARRTANHLALKAATSKHPINHIFAFHESIAASKSFSGEGGTGNESTLPGFAMSHVDGQMSASKREGIIKTFKAASRAILSNARCLTEGVDVPSVDLVAFMSPRRSRVDIVQAIGRAMRLAEGKKTGYILLPIYVELGSGESVEEALHRSNYGEIWSVLHALAEQDEVLANAITQATRAGGTGAGNHFEKIIEVLGQGLDLSILRKAIDVQIVARLGEFWERRFAELKAFKRKHGHTCVPAQWKQNPGLGVWVSHQRYHGKRGELTQAETDLLNSVDFVWDTDAHQWEDAIRQLEAFKEKHGHCRVPVAQKKLWTLARGLRVRRNRGCLTADRIGQLDTLGFVWDPVKDFWLSLFKQLSLCPKKQGRPHPPSASSIHRLGQWSGQLRQEYHAGKLEPWKVKLLESISFDWDPLETRWREGFEQLSQYQKEHKTCHVPVHLKSGLQLRAWSAKQRAVHQAGRLPAEKVKLLESIGFVWAPVEAFWCSNFEQLVAFKKKHDNCDVLREEEEFPGLYGWCNLQRQRRRTGKITQDHLKALVAIGLNWDPHQARWEILFRECQAFTRRHGHCDLSSARGRLKTWCAEQRAAYREDRLPVGRAERLNALGFEWEPVAASWNENIRSLAAFKRRYGHCNVSQAIPEDVALAIWLSGRRVKQKKGQLPAAQFCQLSDMGVAWDAKEARRSGQLAALRAFKARHGHLSIPKIYPECQSLVTWVTGQRRLRRAGKLSTDMERELTALGFDWSPHDSAWENMFTTFAEIHRKCGHCQVPGSPLNDIPSGLALWVKLQRALWRKGKLLPSRFERLNALGFVWRAQDQEGSSLAA
jgi:superfamily II DNA or RNA helicase